MHSDLSPASTTTIQSLNKQTNLTHHAINPIPSKHPTTSSTSHSPSPSTLSLSQNTDRTNRPFIRQQPRCHASRRRAHSTHPRITDSPELWARSLVRVPPCVAWRTEAKADGAGRGVGGWVGGWVLRNAMVSEWWAVVGSKRGD